MNLLADRRNRPILIAFVVTCLLVTSFGLAVTSTAFGQSDVRLEFIDKASGAPISARLEFLQPTNKAPRPKKSLVCGRQLLVESTAAISTRPGEYEFMIRRGPEFAEVRAGFTVERNAKDVVEIVVPHKTPMRAFGWFSGDLLTSMAPANLIRWSAAESLDVVVTTSTEPIPPSNRQVASSKNKNKKDSNDDSSHDQSLSIDQLPKDRDGLPDYTLYIAPKALEAIQSQSYFLADIGFSGVLIHLLPEPVASDDQTITQPDQSQDRQGTGPIAEFFESINNQSSNDCFFELVRPWEDFTPIVLSTQWIDAVQVLSTHLQPESSQSIDSKIRNPDPLRFKGTKGLGRLSEYIYWQMLEAGFRPSLTAGSGFDGQAKTIVGYNRVYAWLDNESNSEVQNDAPKWWQAVKAGKTMVTNGPLLRVKINGERPGAIMPGYGTDPISMDIEMDLTVRDPVEYLDVIFNGKTMYQARLEQHAARGSFPPLAIKESGWLLVRVVTEYEKSYRIATTAPFYFEFDGKQRISKKAVGFFKDWLNETSSKFLDKSNGLKVSEKIIDQNEMIESAKTFWDRRLEESNAE